LILVTVWDTPKDAKEFLEVAGPILVPKAATGESGSNGRFERTIERAGESDEVVVRVCSGIASGDAPNVAWKVAK